MSTHRPDGDDDPVWDSLGDDNKVSADQWHSVLSSFEAPSAVNSEMSADEVEEILDEAYDTWEPPAAPAVGWRSASPGLVLSFASFGIGIAALVLGAVFFRPLPGFATLIALALTGAGAAGLFFSLPHDRRPFDGDDGAQV